MKGNIMNLLDQAQTARNSIFTWRVTQALVKACIAVAAEDPATPNHANRIEYSKEVLNDPERAGQVVAMGVVTNTSIDASSLDSDIEWTVNSMFDAYAGVG